MSQLVVLPERKTFEFVVGEDSADEAKREFDNRMKTGAFMAFAIAPEEVTPTLVTEWPTEEEVEEVTLTSRFVGG